MSREHDALKRAKVNLFHQWANGTMVTDESRWDAINALVEAAQQQSWNDHRETIRSVTDSVIAMAGKSGKS